MIDKKSTPEMKFAILNSDRKIVFLDPFELLEWMTLDPDNGDPRQEVDVTEVFIGHTVSTVFLGGPVFGQYKQAERMFETAILTDEGTHIVERYGSWDDALKGHDVFVEKLRSEILD